MTQDELAMMSFADLRDRLKARADQPGNTEDVDINEALRYLMALPDDQHTVESAEALIQLAKNFHYAEKPATALEVASHAARIASAMEQKLLRCVARGIAGLALNELGRFADAAVAHAESWSLAREMGDRRREIAAIINFGQLCGGMGQHRAASRYYERAYGLAEHDNADLEFIARQNFAACALSLGEPASGLRALSQLGMDEPQTRQDTIVYANAHDTLASLYLLVGDLSAARIHAEKSARFAKITGLERLRLAADALLGHIEIHSGAVERGLSAVDRLLAFVRHASQRNLPIYLGLCIDAYEAAGYPDRALGYLQELVDWKKKSIDAQVMPLQCEGLTEPTQFEVDVSPANDGLIARAHLLHAGVQERTRRLAETAINAEIASGHDLYRTFRVATLARHFAASLGWDEERTDALALGAQLCNIGMIAIPTRILLKPGNLSEGEHHIVRDHTRYGAELLREAKLQMFDRAAIVAEEHHERYNGSGYPTGLVGEAIAEEARMAAICDAFDAMTHQRPSRAIPLSSQAALEELKRCAGEQFDPRLVDVFIDLFQRELSQHADLDAFLAEGADEFEYVRARARMEALISDR